MTTTRVVHVNSAEWRATPEDQRVYIGRAVPRKGFAASKWANPFKIGPGGTSSREDVIMAYRMYLRTRIDLVLSIEELTGKTLGCWCHPEKCHGDVLVEVVEWARSEAAHHALTGE